MQTKLTHKKIGIWGFGVSGQSLLRYLTNHNESSTFGVLEKNLIPELQLPYATAPVTFYKDEPEQRHHFLESHDIIIPSPGIDLRPYAQYSEKFLAEADLFYLLWKHRKIIGITGTLGKTSITHLLNSLLTQAGLRVATGGNIGTGMFDLLNSDAEYALLELSSFQLENCKHFVADIGVITNLYPNHLDRHETMENYAKAKYTIFARQTNQQHAVVPLEHAPELRKDFPHKPFAFFTKNEPAPFLLEYLLPDDTLYTLDILETIPALSYAENWLIIANVLDLLGLDSEEIISQAHNLTIPDYRLEKVATIQGVSYYNDSKSTIMQATLAAVDALKKNHEKNIIVVLGGTSKGVDRSPFVQNLHNKVNHVICFGSEAQHLHAMCQKHTIPATAVATLEQAVAFARTTARNNMAVVLSPGGASFDLFKDYKERGERFKSLVMNLSK